MKRILFWVPLTLISVLGFSQLPLEKDFQQGIDLKSVFFTSTNNGCTVGNSGAIFITNDGGMTWINSPSHTSCNLNSVYFINGNCGYAVGGGAIIKTVDNGANWNVLSYVSNRNLTSVYFTDSLTGVAVGYEIDTWNAIALKTDDGGNTWYMTYQNNFFDSYSRLFGVYFTNTVNGYAVGYVENAEGPSGILLTTFDGGETWITQRPFGFNPLRSISFPSHDTGYIAGGNGNDYNFTVYKTMDGWDFGIVPQGIVADLFSVFFTDGNHGITTGSNGQIYRTTDGGMTWNLHSIGVSTILTSVYFPDDTTGYIVGNCGIILKTIDAGATWTILKDCGTVGVTEKIPQHSEFTVYPDPAYDKITIEASSHFVQGNLSISNLSGQDFISFMITREKMQIDLSGLPAGTYFIRLTSDKNVATGKFIKR